MNKFELDNLIKTHEETLYDLTKSLENTVKGGGDPGRALNVQKMIEGEIRILESLKGQKYEASESYVGIAKKYLIGERGSGVTSSLLLEAGKFNGIYLSYPLHSGIIRSKCDFLGIESVRSTGLTHDMRGISMTLPLFIEIRCPGGMIPTPEILDSILIDTLNSNSESEIDLGLYNISTIGCSYEKH